LATGGNDNTVFIFDLRKSNTMITTYNHLAAIKALTWIPNKNILVTGGGTADKKIKFWKDGEGVFK
jgi:WD40 repeat protein